MVAALAYLLSGAQAEPASDAGLARLGDALVLLVVTDDGTVSATRDLVVTWGLVAPSVALIPVVLVSWLLAGRVLHIVDRANREVEAAGEERRSRLQEVVHELRTPLAVMGTNLELAAAEPGGDPEAAGFIEAARRAVDRMARTVDDLEGHGRLAVEQGEGPIDLAALAGAAVAEHVGPARARGIHVLIAGSSSTMVPTADMAAVRTAVGNFLSNAVRLCPQGSAVTVDWGELGLWAWIAVGDEGPGLAPHLHARVFERGWRGPHDRNREGGNRESGLGLTIARQLSEAQGGAVTIDSEEGGGTTLTLWLPLGPDADQGVVVAPDRVHPAVRPWRKDLQPA
jgi:signal transduction histidine kinase